MLSTTNEWMAVALFVGAVALASLYVYAVTFRAQQRKQERHLREDALRRRGA
jgi:CHASE1-domain containing sensor protein